MALTSVQLKNLLVKTNLIDAGQFEQVLAEAKQKNVALEDILSDSGFISDPHLGQILADYYQLNFVDLFHEKIDDANIQIIPEIVAKNQRVIVFKQEGDAISIATSNPENFEFAKLLEKKSGKKVILYYATPSGIKEALKYYRSNLEESVKNILQDLESNPQNEENIVQLVNLFLEYAHDNRASDIHIEPLKNSISVRFRIDGVLHEVVHYPKNIHDQIVFRIKIMSRLRTDEHAAAQDGRFDYSKDNVLFDVRVSILPVTDGENVVLRILSERSRRLMLEDLGLIGKDLEKINRGAKKPYGMLLAVGPTGSGKTTTLYAILSILNSPEVNIMTIEDPVEYDIEKVQQTQVNSKKNLTFATGLRSIVRQDPDIIMVGEIRDNETASIAVNAAMTGHLVLSTLHANDAGTTFPRLIEMGVEPFLIASSVNIVIAQRLVRKICEKCRMSYFLSGDELAVLKSEPTILKYISEVYGTQDLSQIRFYKGKGCKNCGGTGYSGRIGIFEVMEITEALRPLIVQKASSDIIENKAKEIGMTSMLHDGIIKVFQGVATLDEIIRATKS